MHSESDERKAEKLEEAKARLRESIEPLSEAEEALVELAKVDARERRIWRKDWDGAKDYPRMWGEALTEYQAVQKRCIALGKRLSKR